MLFVFMENAPNAANLLLVFHYLSISSITFCLLWSDLINIKNKEFKIYLFIAAFLLFLLFFSFSLSFRIFTSSSIGQHLVVNNQLFHKECHEVKKCVGCKKELYGTYTIIKDYPSHADGDYHPDCAPQLDNQPKV